MIARNTSYINKIRAMDASWKQFTAAVVRRTATQSELTDLALDTYRIHGRPFGDQHRALIIWLRFGERSLPN